LYNFKKQLKSQVFYIALGSQAGVWKPAISCRDELPTPAASECEGTRCGRG
jgi:hypothetical protein